MLVTVLRFNFASPQGDPRTQSELLNAALELAQWGESHGITSISVVVRARNIDAAMIGLQLHP